MLGNPVTGRPVLPSSTKPVHAGEELTPELLRAIIDDYLKGQMGKRRFAEKYGRTVKSIVDLLFRDISEDYDGVSHGIGHRSVRTSLAQKVIPVPSSLDPNRAPRPNDISFARELWRKQCVSLAVAAKLLNLSKKVVAKIWEGF